MIRLKIVSIYKLLFVGLMVSASVRAQSIPATDTDLRAAYCIEIINFDIAWYKEAIGLKTTQDNANLLAMLNGYLDAAYAHQRKLAAYLTPKIMSIDIFAIASAQLSGRDDLSRVKTMSNTCISQCSSLSGTAEFITCNNQCQTRAMPDLVALQSKFATCRTLEWLPF